MRGRGPQRIGGEPQKWLNKTEFWQRCSWYKSKKYSIGHCYYYAPINKNDLQFSHRTYGVNTQLISAAFHTSLLAFDSRKGVLYFPSATFAEMAPYPVVSPLSGYSLLYFTVLQIRIINFQIKRKFDNLP
jgi:hypothetical protein